MNDTRGQAPFPVILAEMSNRYGKDPRYVLAGGGNSSWKDDKTMFIKASGTSLGTITAGGFVGMDRGKLGALMEKQYDREDDAKREAAVLSDMMDSRLPGYEAMRPSVETLLHNLFQYAYVLHLHPALVNGMTCGTRGEEAARGLFGEPVIWIPEYKPGYELSRLCEKMIKRYSETQGEQPHVIFIQNHGVFVAANEVGEIDAIYADIMNKLASRATIKPAGETAADLTAPAGSRAAKKICADQIINAPDTGSDHPARAPEIAADLRAGENLVKTRLAALPTPPAYIYYYNNPDLAQLIESREQFKPLSGAFTPDHIVYCKAYFLYLDGQDAKACADMLFDQYKSFTALHGYEPRVICARGIGAFICANTKTEVDNAIALFEDALKITVYSRNFGEPRHMSTALTDFIANWEIEQYRQKIAREQ